MKSKLLAVAVALVLVWAWGCARQERILIKEPVNYQNSLPVSKTNLGHPLRQDVFIYKIKNGLAYRVELEVTDRPNINLDLGGMTTLSFKKTYYHRVVIITGSVIGNKGIIGTISDKVKIPSRGSRHKVREEGLWHITKYKQLGD